MIMRVKLRPRCCLVLKLVIFLVILLAGWLYRSRITDHYLTKQQPRQPNTYKSCKGPWVKWYENFHAKSLQNRSPRKTTRFLVYECRGQHEGCGGFGNRMVGIVSLFYLAMLTNRVFLIHWGGPNRLETFLQPNKINWTYDEPLLQGLKGSWKYWGVWGPPGNYNDFRIEEYSAFLNWTENENFDIFLNQDVESIGTIWYFADQFWKNPHLYKQAKDLGLPPNEEGFPFAILGCAIDFLFKKSPYLEETLTRARRYLKLRPRPYIGIHIRTSDHHWGDPNPSSVRTKDPEKVLQCVQRVQTHIQAKIQVGGKRVVSWFLAADNLKIKESWLKKFPTNILTLKLNPKHLEHSSDVAVLRDILVDIFLLSESDYFIATWDSTFSYVVIGIRGFSTKSVTYGENCNIKDASLELAY